MPDAFEPMDEEDREFYEFLDTLETSSEYDNDALWDDARAAKFLATCADAFARLDRSLAKPDFVLPKQASVGDPADYLLVIRDLAQLVDLRALSRLRSGDTAGAVEDAWRFVRWGQRIEDGQGSLISVLVGISVKAYGTRWLERIARRRPPSRDRCIEIARELARFETRKEAVQTALREEYRLFSAVLDDPDAGGDIAGMGRWLVRPNRTRELFLTTYRLLVDAEERPFRGPPVEEPSRSSDWFNFLGEMFHELVTSVLPNGVNERYRSNSVLRMVRTLLALRAYHVDHDRLPDRLDALVPEYLDAVPRDPFDGEPLRYSAAERQLWSVGTDLTDDGGSDEEDRVEALSDVEEPTLRWVKWSTP